MSENITSQALPYNPDDLDSVENFWDGSRIEHQGKVIGVSRRIKECESAKVQVTLTLSPRVVDFLKTQAKTGKRKWIRH
jgi:hypothetical protein